MFQADGQEDGVHRPGIGHVNPGAGMHFGPVKKAVKRLLSSLLKARRKGIWPNFAFQLCWVWSSQNHDENGNWIGGEILESGVSRTPESGEGENNGRR